jgi:hypothetical protein
MGEDYLLLRRAALLARTNDVVSNIESTIKQLADVNLALGSGGGGIIDTSTLAKDATSTAINAKLPSLSSGRVPVSLPTTTAGLDCRLLTTNTTIATGSYFIYLKVIAGDVTINGLTFSSGENLNFEAINNVLYPAIELVISNGKSVRLVRGY